MPKVVDCNPQNTDGILTFEGDEWNCNPICPADSSYFVPYVSGDFIDIQTRFHDSSSDPNDFYLTVELLDKFGNVESNIKSEFLADWMVGIDNKDLSYQIVRIDTSLIELDCFQLRFSYQGVVYTTQWFRPTEQCKNYIKIKSEHRTDCFGNYYGETDRWAGSNNIQFNNEMRYKATLKYGGTVVSSENNLIYYRLITDEMLAPFANNLLALMHLAGKKVFIEDVEYSINGVPRSIPRPNSSMVQMQTDLEKRCKKGC
jgi:hypothetical protein